MNSRKLCEKDYKASYVNLFNDLITFLNEAQENKITAWVKFGSILSVLKTVIEAMDDDYQQDEDNCPDCCKNEKGDDVIKKFETCVESLKELKKAVEK
jgi:hypothetical protein